MTRIAEAFEAMPHDPSNPAVKASYAAMIRETLAQYEVVKATGLKIEPFPGGIDTYGSPRNAILDVVENNHLYFFPTDSGFGGPLSTQDVSDNPLLAATGEYIGDHKMLANDVFRVVHDYFGHIKEGVGFRAGGEENAWQSHARMYSDEALGAMTTETRGQNSWVNFGPFAEFNKTASGADTKYADQKIGLLPEFAQTEGGPRDDLRFSAGRDLLEVGEVRPTAKARKLVPRPQDLRKLTAQERAEVSEISAANGFIKRAQTEAVFDVLDQANFLNHPINDQHTTI